MRAVAPIKAALPGLRRARRAVWATIALLFAGLWASSARAELSRGPRDADELAQLRSADPEATRLLETGEAQVQAGNTAIGAQAFAEAADRAPWNALVARRRCEALAALGRRDDAVAACGKALELAKWPLPGARMPVVLRATAGAWLSGSGAPSVEAVGQALAAARRATQMSPSEPWGYAAMCDLARRIGDDVMLQRCLADLERVAPENPETLRARAAAAAVAPGWGVLGGWVVLLAAAIATAVAAVARRRRSHGLSAAATLAVLATVTTAASAKPGDDRPTHVSQWKIDDNDPDKSIPSEADRQRNPLEMGYWMMDLIAKGQEAVKAGNHAAAIKYFTTLSKVVPDTAIPFMKLCNEYKAMGDWVDAAANCAKALTLKGATLDDQAAFIGVMVGKPGRWDEQETHSVSAVFQRLKNDRNAHGVEALECAIGVKEEDVSLLDECVPRLVASAPDETMTLMAQWTLAAKKGDKVALRGILAHANALNLPPETIANLEDQLQAAPTRFLLWLALGFCVLVAIGAAGFFVLEQRKQPPAPPAPPPVVPEASSAAPVDA